MTLRFGHGTVTTLPRRADLLAAGIFVSGYREASVQRALFSYRVRGRLFFERVVGLSRRCQHLTRRASREPQFLGRT